VFHELGFYAAHAVAVPVVVTGGEGQARAAAIVFCSCLTVCFGASALYHRPTWKPPVRAWLARLDHPGVYLLIAGTYTPFSLLVLSTAWAIPVLVVVWAGALAATVLKFVWLRALKWLAATIVVGLGCSAAFSQLLKLHVGGVLLVVAGGILYTAGAIVDARRRPDPLPSVFRYHELFHVLTLAAAGCQFSAVAFFVLPPVADTRRSRLLVPV